MIQTFTGSWARRCAVVAGLAGLALQWAPPAAAGGLLPVAGAAAGSTDRIIVKYRAGAGAQGMAGTTPANSERIASEIAAGVGLTMERVQTTALGAQVYKASRRMSDAEAAALAARLASGDGNIEYAEPDYMKRILATPNDTKFSQQWALFETTAGINAPAAWDKSTGTGVTVAVLDTGYRPHADLAANVINGYDFIGDTFVSNDGDGRDADAKDPGDWVTSADGCGFTSNSSWHGTHTAGTVAAITNNATGVAGVAYGAKVLAVRVLGKCGGYDSDIADAIVWASGGTVSGVPANTHVAKVISMSLGGLSACGSTLQAAITAARSRGTAVVVAAGNSNDDVANYSPANCTGVIAVAAVGRTGAKAYYSNFGTGVTIAAPGGDESSSTSDGVLSTLNTGTTTPGADTYAFYQGTSMATPHVAGIVALMLAKNASLTPDQIASKLKSTARPFPAACAQCGAGIVDAKAAVNSASPATIVTETEPDDTTANAQSISAPNTTVNGAMSSPTDVDYYKIELPANGTLIATLTPNAGSDFDLYVYNSTFALLGQSENGKSAVDKVTVGNPNTTAKTRFIKVIYYGGKYGAANGKYTLNLSW